MKKPKQKRCKVCRTLFTPFRTLDRVCSLPCAVEFGQSKEGRENAKKEKRKENKQQKLDLKPLAHWIDLTRTVVHRYIRLRDKDLPCITCGTFEPSVRDRFGGVWDAGHYRTQAAASSIRFHPDNIHRQCKGCNSPRNPQRASQAQENYRPNLINRIGEERVEWLEAQNDTKKWTREELKEIRTEFSRLTRELMKELEAA